MQGKITKYIDEKGYGFITGDDQQNYFFHISKVVEGTEPETDMVVNFNPTTGPKGLIAESVEMA